ncbi:penicillin-binding protein activator LpoB [Oxalobacter vibrioformis]|uniref:Penicillin-binding protein activator LpoB n=1 Tax=Oxalobacter vibrioformis TaxID=933080 RepID=A0A9E9P3K7_9BURK|nr:penicillin-binding protein activator LpoB [Oxalobacter vibrioformis]WAW10335.1 penicillin-binding protein activator LpoB [Oxalobacter vibrioformis]
MKKLLRYSSLSGFVALAVLLSACSGPQTGRVSGDGEVVYEDAQAAETVTTKWGSTDLQSTAESMAQSLLASKWIAQASSPPKVRLRDVKNYTDEHIDTKGITDKIRIKLLNSGQVRFLTDKGNMDDVFDERDLNEMATKRKENKLMMDADYIVTGSVRSIRKRTKSVGDVYFQITLELTDPQSGEIKWADEKEIRKRTTKPSIGW